MPSILIEKNQLYYEIEGEGPPLILIAGYGCDLSSWETVRKTLAAHFQLIMLDNRGMGRSECRETSYSIEDMAHDVLALAAKLNLKKPHILGHSMGGAVTQLLAYKHSDKIGKTIIAQSFMKLRVAARSALLAFLNLYGTGTPVSQATRAVLPWLFSDTWLSNPPLCELFTKLQSENPYFPKMEELAKQHEALSQFDSRPWISKITTEPLILAGSEDRLSPLKDIEALTASIPKSKLHIFQKVGHIAPLENPYEFCQVVIEFLKK